jgi:hypothetical protein
MSKAEREAEARRRRRVAAATKWQGAHPEKTREYARRYYLRHREAILAGYRDAYKREKERRLAARRPGR